MQPHSVLSGSVRTFSRNGKVYSLDELTNEWSCKKRDNTTVRFDYVKIQEALKKCFNSLEENIENLDFLCDNIVISVINNLLAQKITSPGVEDIQRLVIQQLWSNGLFTAAEHYQNYREQRRKARLLKPISKETLQAFSEDQKHFPTDLQYYQYISKFSRWNEEAKRRETWKECCFDRVLPWLFKQVPDKLTKEEKHELGQAMYNLEVSPAMRVVQMAGPALDRCSVGAFNCAYMPICDLFCFPELLYILMQGTGVGFSCESDYVSELPRIKKQKNLKPEVIKVPDSTEGWCDSYYKGLQLWFDGYDCEFDISAVRKKGSRLKTKGGFSSGGQCFVELMDFTRNIIIARSKTTGILSDTDVHRICCFIGRIVQVGGVRRAAEISLSDLHSQGMRDIKSGAWWADNTFWPDGKYLSMANNSAVYNSYPDIETFMDEMLALIKSKSGERGIFNREGAINNRPSRRKLARYGVNPCLTGNTKVYVADGRTAVSIKQLAKEKKDVPVFCLADDGSLVVRMLRHPRVTGYKVPVLKVTFDNGEFLRVTPNHRFRLRRGEYVAAQYLEVGDSLAVAIRYTPEQCEGESRADKYITVESRGGTTVEHRAIASFTEGREILPDEHVHHIDGNKLNNLPENLEIKDAFEHVSLHSTGLSNPTSTGITNKQLIKIGRNLTKSLGRKFSSKEWNEFALQNSLPRSFSTYRRKTLGTINAFAKRCALLEGITEYTINEDPRTVRVYQKAIAAGLEAEIINSSVYVHKECEHCGDMFTVKYGRREQGYCSPTCSAANISKGHIHAMLDGGKKSYLRRKKQLQEKQLEVFLKLQSDLDRQPMKKEWVVACRLAGVSIECSRKSSPFTSWDDLVEASKSFNHKVVSVEEDGYADVYNGTVDDFHNFFVGGWDEGLTKSGRRRVVFINNAQCGEVVLKGYEMCNLSICIARKNDTINSLKRKVRLATIFGSIQSTCTNFNYIRPEWKINCDDERLLGVDITGQADCPLLQYNAPDRGELLRELKEVVAKTRIEFAKRFNINESAADTCTKPGGDSAVLLGCSSGISDRFSEQQIRWVREPKTTPVAQFLIDSGVPYADAPENSDLYVFGFPLKSPEGSTTRNDHTALEQLEMWLETKKNWAEHSVSVTIYVEPHEWPDVISWCYKKEHWDFITGISFLPKDNGSYSFCPNQEISKEEYNKLREDFPKLNWSKLIHYEQEDQTSVSQTYACVGGSCEI